LTESSDPVVASILIGSVNGGEMIQCLLEALEQQSGEIPFEVIVADRCGDETADLIEARHPEVRVLRGDARRTLPELRTMAFERALGRFILVTEDHTVPPSNWIEGLVDELDGAPQQVVGVGGPVDNAMRLRAVDWAAFFCEYSAYLPPGEAGEVEDLPGMNIAYRRDALEGVDRESLAAGFWELTVHPRLLADGRRFRLVPDAVILHRKRFGFFEFITQRFHYSRHFAGQRCARTARTLARRWLYAALALALPLVISIRIGGRVWGRPAYRGAFLRSLPALSVFSLSWGIGESVGYLFGSGDSLRKIE
jgi:glycosyltransferase involved in cell wall biosynthesis